MKVKFSIATISPAANADYRGKVYGCIISAIIDFLIPGLISLDFGNINVLVLLFAFSLPPSPSISNILRSKGYVRLHRHIYMYHPTIDSVQLMRMIYTSTGLPGLP